MTEGQRCVLPPPSRRPRPPGRSPDAPLRPGSTPDDTPGSCPPSYWRWGNFPERPTLRPLKKRSLIDGPDRLVCLYLSPRPAAYIRQVVGDGATWFRDRPVGHWFPDNRLKKRENREAAPVGPRYHVIRAMSGPPGRHRAAVVRRPAGEKGDTTSTFRDIVSESSPCALPGHPGRRCPMRGPGERSDLGRPLEIDPSWHVPQGGHGQDSPIDPPVGCRAVTPGLHGRGAQGSYKNGQSENKEAGCCKPA